MTCSFSQPIIIRTYPKVKTLRGSWAFMADTGYKKNNDYINHKSNNSMNPGEGMVLHSNESTGMVIVITIAAACQCGCRRGKISAGRQVAAHLALPCAATLAMAAFTSSSLAR
jgi:hypothetical protein